MNPINITKLSLMMLLEYFIWSAWYVTMNPYMKNNIYATDVQIGAAYSALAIATIISPFFVGMIADRYFAAQRLMGVLHLLGGALLYFATQVDDPNVFYWIILGYSLLYMPTIALSNSIAFHQMSDPGKQFPWIRVFGTIGWIVAGLMISAFGVEEDPFTFHMAAIASVALGIFSFMLPNTPPKGKSTDTSASSILGTEAFVLFRDKPYLIFFIAAVLVCIPLSFYYSQTSGFLTELGMDNVAGKMTLGQISEAAFIVAIPFLFNSIGVKKMIIIGMIAWVLRYVFFAYGDMDSAVWMLYAGIILHGICYDFFFVTGYMYTEKKAGEKIKASAQGLFTVATYGVGMVIGTAFSGYVAERYQTSNGHDWTTIWYVPAGIAAAVLVYFMIFFNEKREIQAAA